MSSIMGSTKPALKARLTATPGSSGLPSWFASPGMPPIVGSKKPGLKANLTATPGSSARPPWPPGTCSPGPRVLPRPATPRVAFSPIAGGVTSPVSIVFAAVAPGLDVSSIAFAAGAPGRS
jgi:hypothetical protein